MSCNRWSNMIVAGSALAIAISTGACDKGDVGETTGHEGAPITMTGCLQRGDGINNFVLTQVNRPSDTPVATTGDSAAVQREQMREAKHAYELEGDKDGWQDLVGKQVRVTGTIADNSDLPRAEAERRDSLTIDANDLAKVDVERVEKVADVCGDNR
jgi:hypothetical protein